MGELDVKVNGVEVLKKLVSMFCPLDDKGDIHIAKPQFWWMDGSVDGLGFKLFHEEVGYNGTGGIPYGRPIHHFVILTLGEEIGIFKAKLQQFGILLY